MRVAIAGAGVAGLTAAIALSRCAGVDTVNVYERHPGVTAGIGLAVNLSPNGMRVLGRLGLVDNVIKQGCRLRTWVMRHSDGDVITQFPLSFERDFGYPMVAIRRDLLVEILLAAAVDAGVTLCFNRTVTAVEPHPAGVSILFADGRNATADTLAACDGTRSRIKTQLLGPHPANLTGQGQSFGISEPGAQHALITDTFATTLGTEGYFGGYDIGHQQMLWFVGYNIDSAASRSGPDLTADYALPVIQRITSGWHSPLPRIISSTTRFGALAVERQPAPRTLCAGRVVFLGDAAHPVQPHFGQGANLALEDAITIAHLLQDVPSRVPPGAIEQVLTEYTRIRLPRRLAVANFSQVMGRRFHWTNPMKRRLRDLTLHRMGAHTMDTASWIYEYDNTSAPPVQPHADRTDSKGPVDDDNAPSKPPTP